VARNAKAGALIHPARNDFGINAVHGKPQVSKARRKPANTGEQVQACERHRRLKESGCRGRQMKLTLLGEFLG